MSLENVYKNLDAKTYVALHGKKPEEIYKRLDKLYSTALESKKRGKIDNAYIECKRWFNFIEWLQNQKLDKGIAQKYFPPKKITEVERTFKDIKLRIESDYLIKHGKFQIKKTPKITDELDLASMLPDVPTEEPQPKNMHEITNSELYQIMHDSEKRDRGVLIIDVREADDFTAQKMAFQDFMINIPESKILPKKTVNYYQTMLRENDAAYKRFLKRHEMDIIVLVDWGITQKSNAPISIFKKFLEEHDRYTDYKRIAILKGGFNEWMKKYPKLVVRPEAKKPEKPVNEEQQSEIKMEIDKNFGFDFPSSPGQNSSTSSPILSTKGSQPFTPPSPQVMNNNAINASLFNNTTSFNTIPPFASTPNQIKNNTFNAYNTPSSYSRMSDQPLLYTTHNQQIIPTTISNPSVLLNDISNYTENPILHPASAPPPVTNQSFYPTLNGAPKMKEPKVIIEKLPPAAPPAKPTVDRSSKPVPGRKLSSDNSHIAKIEGELANTRNIIAMYEKSLTKGSLDSWSREQYETCKKMEEELCKDLEKMKSQGPSAPKNGKLYPDLTNNLSGLALNNKPRSTRPVKPDIKIEDKENIQQPQVKIERMKIDPPNSTVMQRPQLPPPQQTPKPQIQRMDIDDSSSNTYREPLKSEPTTPNTGLKRSHSSPNLQKVKKHKANHQALQNTQEGGRKFIPQIDRSSKPQISENNVRVPILSSKDREERMEPVYGNFHPGITGLKNLGNSCYMNSIIQCLSNTSHLAKYFNDNRYANDLNKKNDKNRDSGYVAEEVAQVIKALWRGQYKSISPRDLKVVVGQYKYQFENYDQQDSHEFLMFLLDWMHNDLKKKSKVTYARELTIAEKEWEKSLEGQSSVISDLFYGQLRSTIECTTCMQTSTTYETFNSLTMSLPSTNKCTLDDCVRKYVSGQKVSGWKCPNCKAPRDGVKKFDIAKLPHTIIIHLNRFGDSGGWLEKKNTAVEFPLLGLDLKPYVVPDPENNSPTSRYNLYAMSNHYGTMDGGHYTAYCRSSPLGKWYKYDDHTVSEVQSNQVRSQSTSAYLLFYASESAEKIIMNS